MGTEASSPSLCPPTPSSGDCQRARERAITGAAPCRLDATRVRVTGWTRHMVPQHHGAPVGRGPTAELQPFEMWGVRTARRTAGLQLRPRTFSAILPIACIIVHVYAHSNIESCVASTIWSIHAVAPVLRAAGAFRAHRVEGETTRPARFCNIVLSLTWDLYGMLGGIIGGAQPQSTTNHSPASCGGKKGRP